MKYGTLPFEERFLSRVQILSSRDGVINSFGFADEPRIDVFSDSSADLSWLFLRASVTSTNGT